MERRHHPTGLHHGRTQQGDEEQVIGQPAHPPLLPPCGIRATRVSPSPARPAVAGGRKRSSAGSPGATGEGRSLADTLSGRRLEKTERGDTAPAAKDMGEGRYIAESLPQKRALVRGARACHLSLPVSLSSAHRGRLRSTPDAPLPKTSQRWPDRPEPLQREGTPERAGGLLEEASIQQAVRDAGMHHPLPMMASLRNKGTGERVCRSPVEEAHGETFPTPPQKARQGSGSGVEQSFEARRNSHPGNGVLERTGRMAESSLRRRRSPRRGPFTSIAWRQATLGVAAAVLLSLLLGALQIVAEYHRSSEEFERLTQEISAGISPFAAQAIVGDDHVMARKVTRSLIRHPLILKASMVHRPSGYPLAESGTGKQHSHERRRVLLLLLGDEEVEQSLPIRNRAGEVIGELRLSIDRGWIASRSLDQALSTFSSNLFEDLLLATLLVALLNRMVIRPVSNIIARINRVDPSNPRPLTPEPGDPPVDDEVGTLLSATNRLLADIRRQFRARQEEERRIQQLLDSTAEGIIGFDPEMRGTFINREALRMLGLTEEVVVGRPLEQWLGWMESEECRLWDVFDSRGAGERSQSGTATFRHRDGSRFPVEYWLTPLADPDNRAQGVVLSFVDITEKQRILLQLEDSERELRAIFEGMHDIYYRLDAEGRIVRMTPSAERLFGYPVEELIGRNAREFYLHPSVLEELVRRLRAEGEVTD
ncbi:MAG TPA: PAS domain S-box protein, partial [Thiotrichales bacterium]|nr:PAS domain S-box protein [Thiotrichales bacterium]